MKRIYCDRCGSGTELKRRAGGVDAVVKIAVREKWMQNFTEIDLCDVCKEEMIEWIKAGRKKK